MRSYRAEVLECINEHAGMQIDLAVLVDIWVWINCL